MIEFLIAFFIWIAVFLPASLMASLVARENPRKAVFLMQVLLLLSLVFMESLGGPKRFGFIWSSGYILPAFLMGFSLSFLFNLFSGKAREPEFLPENLVEKFFLLLLLAPLSEEALNRGLVEEYLLQHGRIWGAVFFSAVLFAVPHLKAFEEVGNRKRAIIFGSAFLLGSLTGYLFALGGIIPAFIAHSSANLAGVLNPRERPGYK
ncbi:CPBP family intramembrane glutamic endopeptidase [Thermococcus sp.]